jgi:hypothetical protein
MRTMRVTDLMKHLQEWPEDELIAFVRIEFGDGSIYESPPGEQTRPRPAVPLPRRKLTGELKPDRTSKFRN